MYTPKHSIQYNRDLSSKEHTELTLTLEQKEINKARPKRVAQNLRTNSRYLKRQMQRSEKKLIVKSQNYFHIIQKNDENDSQLLYKKQHIGKINSFVAARPQISPQNKIRNNILSARLRSRY